MRPDAHITGITLYREKDLSQVLQMHTIYTNVAQGVIAKKADITKVFGKADTDEICKEILKSGELQLGDRERKEMQENIWRDIATIVCEKCVDKSTQRPLTVSIVERAMTDIHYNINPKKNAKQQALDVIKQLMEKGYPVERAKIVLRLTAESKGEVREVLKQFIASVVSEQETPIYTLEFAIEPSQFKNIESVIHDYGVRTSNKCSLEIVSTGQAVATDTFV